MSFRRFAGDCAGTHSYRGGLRFELKKPMSGRLSAILTIKTFYWRLGPAQA
jgi:hypothetical protein